MALIYCVEDDENIRELVGYALRSQDFEVETFADGKEFWKAVQQRVPALVLLDIMLPGESGTEILDKIRKDTQLRSPANTTSSAGWTAAPTITSASPSASSS